MVTEHRSAYPTIERRALYWSIAKDEVRSSGSSSGCRVLHSAVRMHALQQCIRTIFGSISNACGDIFVIIIISLIISPLRHQQRTEGVQRKHRHCQG